MSAPEALQDLRQQRQQVALYRSQRLAGIDHLLACRRLSSALEIGITHGFEEAQTFLLETIKPPTGGRSAQADIDPQIEYQRQVRTQVALHEVFQLLDTLLGQAAATTPVGIGGVGEAGAQSARKS